MKDKKRIILIFFLVAVLSFMFYLQNTLIIKFSSLPERLEFVLNENSQLAPLILEEGEYISEEYSLGHGIINDNYFITIEKPMGLEDEFFRDRFIDYLRFKISRIDVDDKDLEIRDYSLTKRVLIEWNKATKLSIVSLAFILIVIILIKKVRFNYTQLRINLDTHYLKEIIHLKTNEILEEAIKLVVLIFSGVFLLQWIIGFQFNIPGKYLPIKDIFDFKFYKSLNNPIKINLSNYGQYYYATLNKVRLLTLGICSLAFCIFILIIKIKTNVRNGEGDKHGQVSL